MTCSALGTVGGPGPELQLEPTVEAKLCEQHQSHGDTSGEVGHESQVQADGSAMRTKDVVRPMEKPIKAGPSTHAATRSSAADNPAEPQRVRECREEAAGGADSSPAQQQ